MRKSDGFSFLLPLVVLPLFWGCAGSSNNNNPGTPPPVTVVNPTVASIAPASLGAGAPATTITVTGTGFTAGTAIQVGGSVEPTTYTSSTQVSAVIPASQLIQGGTLAVIALNGTATSASGTETALTINNPVPAITTIVPATLFAGSPSLSVDVIGTGFVPATTLQIGGSARPTAYIGPTEMSVIVTAADLASPGSLALTALNPAPAGGSSAAVSADVTNPLPGPGIYLKPTVLTLGTSAPTAVTVSGSFFVATSVVQVNGSNRATTFVNSSTLTFLATVADQASTGYLLVTVVTPAPGGGSSLSSYLQVLPPAITPVITAVSPTQFVDGTTNNSVQVSGTNFNLNSQVQWNGTPLTTQVFNGPYGNMTLFALVPDNLVATAGTAMITVNNPTATPPLSNAVSVTIVDPPPPAITSISPTNGPINTATPVTISGTGFTSLSTVALNGVTIPSTNTQGNALQITIPASSLALPGNLSLTVSTPAPGGGTSAAAIFTGYINLTSNNIVINPVSGLLYASVPSSAGAPYGNTIVSVDPETGALGTPIPVGSEPNKLAISSDGTILWVGLDGAAAVRQVNLTTQSAGLQFSLGDTTSFGSPNTAVALAALPGAPNSVIVSNAGGGTRPSLAIYDSGVVRGSGITTFYSPPLALAVDGTRQEVYAAGGGATGYTTYTYNAGGLTLLANTTTNATYVNNNPAEIQVTGGKLYSDFGQVFDAESGALLGTFYENGTAAASGPVTADTTLGKAFILDQSAPYSYTYNQIQIFNLSDFNASTAAVLPVSISSSDNTGPSTLTRWGTNGLAFRTSTGIYSLRSNLVKDLSTTNADLGVTVTSSGGTTTGTSTTYVATVNNAGPAAVTNVALNASLPSSGTLTAATPSAGTCSTTGQLSCNLGGLASGATATVTLVVQQNQAGSIALQVQVAGSENDANLANNQASLTVNVTGDTYNLSPIITSLSPAAIPSGSGDTTITLTGTGFTSASTVQLGPLLLASSYVSPTALTAIVPAAQLGGINWAPMTITNPAPGGGISAPLPLTVYKVLAAGLNHILYEPYSRTIYAAVGSGSSSITGNSIAQITPETGAIGTPVYIGSQPAKMALSDDSRVLYTLLTGANSVARFNVTANQTEFTFSPPDNSFGANTTGFRDVAVQTGTENTIALDFGSTGGLALIDVDPVAKTATIRGGNSGTYSGTSLHFYDANDLYVYNSDTFQTLAQYNVTANGLAINSANSSSTLFSFGNFHLIGKIAYADPGGVADVTTAPATQLGIFKPVTQNGYPFAQIVAADPPLGRVFFFASTGQTPGGSSGPDGLVVYNPQTYMPTEVLPFGLAATEGTNSSYTAVDLIRWGQDGLAALTSSGHLYLLRGAAVVPGELTSAAAATLNSNASPLTHGAGNTLITVSGGNFLPGVAVNWNGSYRTTTILDATHVSVAIPASDLTSAGTASLTAINPGAAASAPLSVTIQ